MEIGYHLSSEELPPLEMLAHARRAEQADFSFLTISDHFHPLDAPGRGRARSCGGVLGGRRGRDGADRGSARR